MVTNQDSITVYWKPDCKFCDAAKAMLNKHGLPFNQIELGNDISIEYFKMINPEAKTAPAIFINSKFIGGFTELRDLIEQPVIDIVSAKINGV